MSTLIEQKLKNWSNLEPLTESLRVELDDLQKISSSELAELTTFYHNQRITNFLTSCKNL